MNRLITLLIALCCSPALADVCPTNEAMPHELLVKMPPGVQSARRHLMLARFASGWEHWRVEGDAAREIEEIVEGGGQAEPNYVVWADGLTPTDPLYQMYSAYPILIGLPDAWAVTTGETNGIIAVIDTGTGPHEELDSRLLPGHDALNHDDDASDDNKHGTHMGCIAAAQGNNSSGSAGVSWKARVLPCKFLSGCGSGSTSGAIECIDWAVAHGARSLSNSWSGGGFSQALLDSINSACSSGALFIVSAGNDGLDIGLTPRYPAAYNAPCQITVAATDAQDNLASFSNFSSALVHVGAPGVNVLSCLPFPYTCAGPTLGRYGTLSGTSPATPWVAGAADLVWSVCPTCTNLEVKERILSSADIVPALAGKVLTGRLNVARAVGFTGPVAPSCGDGTCQQAESCKTCEDDCIRVRRPRAQRTCCGDGRVDPGDAACGGDP